MKYFPMTLITILVVTTSGCFEQEKAIIDMNSSFAHILEVCDKMPVRPYSEYLDKVPKQNRDKASVFLTSDSLTLGYYMVPKEFQNAPFWTKDKRPFLVVDKHFIIIFFEGDGAYQQKYLHIFDISFNSLVGISIVGSVPNPHTFRLYDINSKGKVASHEELIPKPFLSLESYSPNDVLSLLKWREQQIKSDGSFLWDEHKTSSKSFLSTFDPDSIR